MADQEILSRVIKVTASVLGLDESEVKPGDNFIFDLGAESSQSVDLVMGFEAEFDIDMDQEKALAVQTVEGAADFIAEYVKA
jgi:acyl carrier protein